MHPRPACHRGGRRVAGIVMCAAAVSSLVMTTVAWPAEAVREGCQAVHPKGHWAAIERPAFPIHTSRDRFPNRDDVVPDPTSPHRVFATDGSSVMRSTDSGCTWTAVFALGAGSLPGLYDVDTRGRIDGLEVPDSGRSPAHQYVYAMLGDGAGPSFVARSTDGGATWTVPGSPMGGGLPACLASACTEARIRGSRGNDGERSPWDPASSRTSWWIPSMPADCG